MKHIDKGASTTVDLSFETVFYSVRAKWLISITRVKYVVTRLEAGSNASTATLRVVGRDEKGSLISEKVKYGQESQATRTRERIRWREPPAYTKDRPVLSSESAPQKIKTVTVQE
jgi:hypothetical protein